MSVGSEDDERALARFAQVLLTSARTDDAPSARQTTEAWSRFEASVLTVGAGVALLSHPTVLARAARRTAAKWALVGAVGGGALTAAFMPLRAGEPPASTGVQVPSVAPAPTVLGEPPPHGLRDAQRVLEGPSGPPTAPGALADPALGVDGASLGARSDPSSDRIPAVARAPFRAAKPPQRAGGELEGMGGDLAARSPHPAVTPSARARSLADEIELLDATRAALARGAAGQALDLMARYRREFPTGALARDAAVVTIEALAKQGNRVEARRRGEQFLSAHPNDANAVRIRWLIDQ